MRIDLPTDRPAGQPSSRAALSEHLTSLAGTAQRMVDILDALRAGPIAADEDVEVQAELRVQLDQAAAAAADLQYTLHSAIRCGQGESQVDDPAH